MFREEVGLGRFELPASSMSRRCHNQTRPQTRLMLSERVPGLAVTAIEPFGFGCRASILRISSLDPLSV